MLMKIIYINIAVFLILRLSAIVCVLFNVEASALQEFLALPASFSELAYRPWTALTYMFVHYDVMHILFNMLLLYWFGQIFLYSSTPKQLVVLYFYGGLAGGLLYILAYTFLPYFRGQSALLIGASASIMAIVVATAIRHHDYNLRLLFIGNVALKWIAIIAIAIDLLSLTDINSGGHLAHIGGAIIGAIYALALNRGIDITRHVNAAIDSIASLCSRDKSATKARRHKTKKTKTAERKADGSSRHDSNYQSGNTASHDGASKTGNASQADGDSRFGNSARTDGRLSEEEQNELDTILEKLKRSGYTGLTADEKRRLFEVSRKIK